MTMKERLKMHRQIEAENREHLEDFRCAMYWESVPAAEIAAMIREKDSRMEWDEQFGFLMKLLNNKLEGAMVV